MTIQLTDNVRMLAALDKVKEGKFFDALCLFARVDSYESILNQIGCLCHMGDTGYAVELYRRLLADYYLTHNCYCDLGKMSGQAVGLLGHFDSALDTDEFDENKVSADEQLLGDFEGAFGFDDEDFFDEYEEIEEEHFCDVTSAEYFFRLVKWLDAEAEGGRREKTDRLVEQLLEFDSDEDSVLEAQMLLCLADRNYEKGAQYAERFAKLNCTYNYRAIAVAVGLLSITNKHEETLRTMLERLLNNANDIGDNDLMEYLEIAEGSFGSDELTGKLAEILYIRYKDIGCAALRSCARIFCNMGWKKLAREAVLTLQSAVPWDSYAEVLRMFVDSDIDAKLDKSFSNLDLMRHIDVPTQLAVIAEFELVQRMENGMSTGEECILTTRDYKLLDCITNVCKTHVYRGNSEKFVNEATVLSTLLFNFKPQSKQEFFDFAKRQLCSFMPEAPVQKDILLRLINLGYKGKLLISADRGYYPLDLSRLGKCDDVFLNAFCLCAALRRVDVRRLQRCYAKIKATVGLSLNSDFEYDTVHKLAYCLLAVSYKDFVESTVAEYFGEGEDQMYLDFIASLTSN